MCCLASSNNDGALMPLLLLRLLKPCYSLCLLHLHCNSSAAPSWPPTVCPDMCIRPPTSVCPDVWARPQQHHGVPEHFCTWSSLHPALDQHRDSHQRHHVDACTNSCHVLQSLQAGVQGHIGTWHRDLGQGVPAGKPAVLQVCQQPSNVARLH